jgi:prepilin-type N-terminal cleavage/methylation domain-containing protein
MRLDQKGFTLIELLVTAALMLVVTMSITNSLRLANKFLNDTRSKRNRDRVISSTLQNIVENVGVYQKNFGLSAGAKTAMLDPSKLPIAWGQDVITTTTACPSCPGRMGFIIEPLDNIGGLNRLTIRITHQQLIQGAQDYVFILSDD